MKDKKKLEILNGRVQSKNFSYSMPRNLSECLILKYGSGTDILRTFFIKRFNVKDNWELEEEVKRLILEKVGISKRDKISKEIQLIMCDDAINYCEIEMKKNQDWDENIRKQFNEWKEEFINLKKELNKKRKNGEKDI